MLKKVKNLEKLKWIPVDKPCRNQDPATFLEMFLHLGLWALQLLTNEEQHIHKIGTRQRQDKTYVYIYIIILYVYIHIHGKHVD